MPVYNPPTYREQCTKVVGFDAATCDYLCDGTSDEVQINAAIAAVVVLGGGCVALQRGTYDIRASIMMGSEVWLHGSGLNTILLRSTANFAMITASSKTKMVISDIYIDGVTTGTYGISFTTCTYNVIERVYITRFSTDGIYLTTNSHYNKILNNTIVSCANAGINVDDGNWCIIQGNIISLCNFGVWTVDKHNVYADNIVSSCLRNGFLISGSDNLLVGNIGYYNSTSAAAYDFALGASNIVAAGNYSRNNTKGSAFNVSAVGCSVVNNVAFQPKMSGFTIGANDVNLTGCSVIQPQQYGIIITACSRVVCVGNHVDGADYAGTNSYDAICLSTANDSTIVGNVLTNSGAYNARDGVRLLGTSADNVICENRIRGYDIGINVSAAACSRTLIKHNVLLNNTACFADAGTDTKLASVIVPFASGYDPQDSGFLVDGEEDFCLTWTMLPVEVQQVVRAKVYGRSVAAEVHSMEADFTVYGAADNEAYTTHNGSDASKASTSVNFAADDVIYWTLTNAGLLAMLGKDSIQVKVDGAAADGDNCATNAYFRTVEIEYV